MFSIDRSRVRGGGGCGQPIRRAKRLSRPFRPSVEAFPLTCNAEHVPAARYTRSDACNIATTRNTVPVFCTRRYNTLIAGSRAAWKIDDGPVSLLRVIHTIFRACFCFTECRGKEMPHTPPRFLDSACLPWLRCVRLANQSLPFHRMKECSWLDSFVPLVARASKVGLLRFLLCHVDRPRRFTN